MKKFIIAILMTSWLLSLGMICAMSKEQQEQLNKEFRSAAFNGNLDKVKDCIAQGAQLNAQDPKNGLTALMKAVINDEIAVIDGIAVIKYLIEKGADVNMQDQIGYTALMYAVINSQLPIIKYLIENGADPKLQNVFKKTVLSFAENRANQPIIDYLQLVTDYQTAEANNKLPEFLQKLYDAKKVDELDDLFAIALNMVPEKNPAAFYDKNFSNHNHYKDPLVQLQIAEKHDFYAPTKTILSKGTKISDLKLRALLERARKNNNNLFAKALVEYTKIHNQQMNFTTNLKRKDFHDLKFKFN